MIGGRLDRARVDLVYIQAMEGQKGPVRMPLERFFVAMRLLAQCLFPEMDEQEGAKKILVDIMTPLANRDVPYEPKLELVNSKEVKEVLEEVDSSLKQCFDFYKDDD